MLRKTRKRLVLTKLATKLNPYWQYWVIKRLFIFGGYFNITNFIIYTRKNNLISSPGKVIL